MGRSAGKTIAWIMMGIGLATTFAEWRRGLVAIGVPNWLSWVIGIPGSAILGIAWLTLAGVMAMAPKETQTWWGGLVWIGICLLFMVAVGGLYIWVCEKGGGINVTFP